jgi:hypothetical protein
MASTLKAQRASATGNYFTVPVDDLSGGLDQRKAATLLKPNRARVLRNFSLREPGALIVWPGFASFSTSSLGSGRPQGGQRVYLGLVSPFTLAAWGGSVYKPSDAGVWGAAVSSGWSASNEVFFPSDRDLVAILDGATAAKKSTDGTTWTSFGIAKPAAAPTAAALAGGTLVVAHVYEFSFTGRDDTLQHESNESAVVTNTPAGANLSVRLTVPKHPDAQVDTLVIYGRDVTAGELVRRQIGTVANPAGASTTFDVTANIWGSGTEAPSDHDVPQLMSFAVVWKNRWWGRDAVVKNRIRFTQIFEAQSWPADFTIDIPFERGDDIAAILPLGDTLLVFGQSKIFVIIGQTSLDFEVRPSGASQAGALGPRAIDAVEEGVDSRLGGWHLPVRWRNGSAAVERHRRLRPGGDRLAEVRHRGICRRPRADAGGLSPGGEGSRDRGDEPLPVRDGRRMDPRPESHAVAGSAGVDDDGSGGRRVCPLGRQRADGRQPGAVLLVVAVDREALRRAHGHDGRRVRHGRDLHRADVLDGRTVARMVDGAVEFEPHAGTFGIELTVDSQSFGSQNVDISGTTSSYGVDVYGTATYGGSGRLRRPLTFPLEAEGLTAEITGTYTGREAFRWFTYTLGHRSRARGNRGIYNGRELSIRHEELFDKSRRAG